MYDLPCWLRWYWLHNSSGYLVLHDLAVFLLYGNVVDFLRVVPNICSMQRCSSLVGLRFSLVLTSVHKSFRLQSHTSYVPFLAPRLLVLLDEGCWREP